MAEEGETKPEDLPKLSLPILETIRFAQQQNGLRHNDYMRYRQYCTRRLRRVRKMLKFTHGRGKNFVKKEVTVDMIKDQRWLFVPLMNAERAWGYAMQLKNEIADSDNSRLKFSMMSRFLKAAYWGEKLAEMCSIRGDNRTVLEASAYSANMSANLKLEQEEWKEAYEQFATSKSVYQELGKIGTVEQQDLYQQKVDDFAPTMRYCEYNLKLTGEDTSVVKDLAELAKGNDMLQSKLSAVMNESRKKQADSMTTVDWRGKQLAVRSQEIRVLILKAQEKQAALATTEEAQLEKAYLEIFSAYDDVMKVVLAEQAKMDKMKSGQKVEAQREELRQIESYVTHHKLVELSKRNKAMVADLTDRLTAQQEGKAAPGDGSGATGVVGNMRRALRPDDLVHMYETLQNNLQELCELPGNDEDEEQYAAWMSELAGYKAFRVFYIAETYANLTKWAEAMLLYGRASELEEAAVETYQGYSVELPAELSALGDKVTAARNRTHARGYLAQMAKADSGGGGEDQVEADAGQSPSKGGRGRAKPPAKTLLDRLQSFDAGDAGDHHSLIDFPPALQPIPCKPLLFDIAYNSISFPNLDEKTGKKPNQGEGGRTWGGWLLGKK